MREAWEGPEGVALEIENAQLISVLQSRLNLIQNRHASDGADSPFCKECDFSWPCATYRLTKGECLECGSPPFHHLITCSRFLTGPGQASH